MNKDIKETMREVYRLSDDNKAIYTAIFKAAEDLEMTASEFTYKL